MPDVISTNKTNSSTKTAYKISKAAKSVIVRKFFALPIKCLIVPNVKRVIIAPATRLSIVRSNSHNFGFIVLNLLLFRLRRGIVRIEGRGRIISFASREI